MVCPGAGERAGDAAEESGAGLGSEDARQRQPWREDLAQLNMPCNWHKVAHCGG